MQLVSATKETGSFMFWDFLEVVAVAAYSKLALTTSGLWAEQLLVPGRAGKAVPYRSHDHLAVLLDGPLPLLRPEPQPAVRRDVAAALFSGTLSAAAPLRISKIRIVMHALRCSITTFPILYRLYDFVFSSLKNLLSEGVCCF